MSDHGIRPRARLGLAALLSLVAAGSATADTLARSGPFRATHFGNLPCKVSMPIIVTGTSADDFADALPALLAVVRGAASALERLCPGLETVSIDGEADFSSVFEGVARKGDDWRLEVVRPYSSGTGVTTRIRSQLTAGGGAGAGSASAGSSASSSGTAAAGASGPGGGAPNPFSKFDPLGGGKGGVSQGGGGVAPGPAPGGGASLRGFRRPVLMGHFHDHDTAALNADRTQALLYVTPIVSALSDPHVWYRIGQDAELYLDPQLMPRIRGLWMTDPVLMQQAAMPGLKGLVEGFLALGEKRQRDTAAGRIDPFGDVAALNRGVLGQMSPRVALSADAEYDAKRLMRIAQSDPATFLRIYDGMKVFVYDQ
jgi:hypothetical protein